jgi:alanine racemase
MVHDLWVEVSLGALRHNLSQVRAVLPETVGVMAVVKGNGFGHGYVEPARSFVEAGASALGVTRLDEALELRAGGITAPILVLAPIQSENADVAVEAGLDCTVDRIGLAQALSDAAVRAGRTAAVHVKVDTGMGRLGLPPGELPDFYAAARKLPALRFAGIFTHFAAASEKDLSCCRTQLSAFEDVLNALRAANIDFGIAHAANSAATLRLPEARFDLVRVGTLLYGQYPPNVAKTLDLKPTWRLKARICSVRAVLPGTHVGYGGEYVTRRASTLAVVPIGFYDGYTLVPEGPVYRMPALKFLARRRSRSLSMTVRNKPAPVLGRVSMQLCVLDVTDIPGVAVGDEVTVPALRLATNPRIPRVYVESF